MRPVSVVWPMTAASRPHLLEDALGLGLAAGLEDRQHPLLALREHHLVGGHALFALGHVVEVELDADAALAGHLDDEEVRPAAPMSWMPTTASDAISSRVASISSFSAKGSPTCTVGRFSSESSSNSAEAMVAPWMPSRPVLEPK